MFQKENVKEILEICLIFRVTESKKIDDQLLAMYLVKSWEVLAFGTATHIHGEKKPYLGSKVHLTDMWLLSLDEDNLGKKLFK